MPLRNIVRFAPIICFFSLFLSVGLQAQFPTEEPKIDPLQIWAQLQTNESRPGEIVPLKLELEFAPEYKAYVDQFAIKGIDPEALKAGQIEVGPQFEFQDKFSDSLRQAVKGKATLTALIETPEDLGVGEKSLKLALTYQACTEKFCLLPKDKEFEVRLKVIGDNSEEPTAAIGIPDLPLGFTQQDNLLVTFALVFLAGILTSLTPCIFPMIPITIAILGKGASERSRLRNFSLSLFYVLGIALTYSLLGILAASTGAMFGSALSNPIVVGAMALLFFAMAISMYGGFTVQAPQFIQQKLGMKETGSGFKGALFMGLIAGIVASPCVGPVLVGILTYVANTQDLLLGFALLFTFAMGLGQLFLILGMSGEVGRFLPKSGPWMDAVKFFFGSLLLGVGFYYLDFILPALYWWGLLGLALVIVTSLYGAFERPAPQDKLSHLKKGLLFALFLLGILFIYRSVLPTVGEGAGTTENQLQDHSSEEWTEFTRENFNNALASGRPVIVDFYADWCGACKQLEAETFSTELFNQKTQGFELLRFDATKPSTLLDELVSEYSIKGLPTILFFDSQGKWQKKLTLIGFESDQQFVERIKGLDQSL